MSTSLDPFAPSELVAHRFPDHVLSVEQLLTMYRTMYLIRRVEVSLNQMHKSSLPKALSGSSVEFEGDEPVQGDKKLDDDDKISGAMHTAIGHEANAVGAAAALRPTDYLTCTYRGHHHSLARGMEPGEAIAEVLGKATGFAKGKGGSMHFVKPSLGLLGANGIVGAQVPHAAGLALASQIRGEERVAITFFGDGAMFQGLMHETFNMAQKWRLPVIFYCENNRLSEMTPINRSSSINEMYKFVHAYGMESMQINGNDVEQVYQAVSKAVEMARRGEGPVYIEGVTYRLAGHMAGDLEKVRDPGQIEKQLPYEPLATLRRKLVTRAVQESVLQQIYDEVDKLVAVAVDFARNSPWPERSEAYTDVYAPK
jgi:pyruvate dehydrogenase E1 component alpha subunit